MARNPLGSSEWSEMQRYGFGSGKQLEAIQPRPGQKPGNRRLVHAGLVIAEPPGPTRDSA